MTTSNTAPAYPVHLPPHFEVVLEPPPPAEEELYGDPCYWAGHGVAMVTNPSIVAALKRLFDELQVPEEEVYRISRGGNSMGFERVLWLNDDLLIADLTDCYGGFEIAFSGDYAIQQFQARLERSLDA
jgi:hypothetical protein